MASDLTDAMLLSSMMNEPIGNAPAMNKPGGNIPDLLPEQREYNRQRVALALAGRQQQHPWGKLAMNALQAYHLSQHPTMIQNSSSPASMSPLTTSPVAGQSYQT